MSAEIKKEIKLEIGHVLFMDIVGYSKLLINQQRTLRETLNEIVRQTETFREADSTGTLIKSPTGDGMALVFRGSVEEPVECALEVSRVLKAHPELPLRVGVHSGPVSGVVDVNDQTSVAGAGINMAQRVMDCGDAGHILLSKHVAEDLEPYGHWQPHLHDLGGIEVKHGVRVHVVNLCTDDLGNPEPPEKFKSVPVAAAVSAAKEPRARTNIRRWTLVGAAIAIAVAIAGFYFFSHRPASKAPTASSAPPSAAPGISEKSIAVLPFENLSRDPDNAYFATGIQDEILTRLAKIGALKVISHNSTQQYATRPGNLPEIARQLGVANILEGSVQKAADQVHINVQLIRAATDEHLWAESYDRKLENIFGVEAEVATAVAEALKAKLTGVEQRAVEQKPTNNAEAYDAYLRGIVLLREDNYVTRLKAAHELEEAVRLDPDFAIAWAMLSRANAYRYNNDATPAVRAAAQQSLENALRLQPELPEVQLAQGFYQYWVLQDYDGARTIFESLRQKLPNSSDIPEALDMISSRQARWEDARIYAEEAIAHSPRDPLLRIEAALLQQATRNFSGALQSYDEALKIWPDDRGLIAAKAEVYQALGELDQADALLTRFRDTATGDPYLLYSTCAQAILRRRFAEPIPLLQGWLETTASSLPLLNKAYWQVMLGDLKRLAGDLKSAQPDYLRARDELEQMLKEQPPTARWICRSLASTYAGLGDRDVALEFADRAIALTPMSKEPAAAEEMQETRARIAARFGMNDVAIPTLERLLNTSYDEPLTPALLRLDPDFDPLRGDPRFEKLVHSDGK